MSRHNYVLISNFHSFLISELYYTISNFVDLDRVFIESIFSELKNLTVGRPWVTLETSIAYCWFKFIRKYPLENPQEDKVEIFTLFHKKYFVDGNKFCNGRAAFARSVTRESVSSLCSY